MSTFTMAEPLVQAPAKIEPYRFTVDEYYQMWEVGIFAPEARLELIEGQIISMPAAGPPHAGTVDQLNQLLITAFSGRAIVRVQSALRLDEWNEPQPDLTILKPREDWYKSRQPTAEDALLVIEVAQTSKTYDRDVKARLYARFGVLEYWIIDLGSKCVEVYKRPREDGYDFMERLERGSIASAAFPDVTVDIASLF